MNFRKSVGGKLLEITTTAKNGQISTCAMVSTRKKTEYGAYIEHAIYDDFYKILARETVKRATKNRIEKQFESCFSDSKLENLEKEIDAFYQKKGDL
jgi:hypothetical protein